MPPDPLDPPELPDDPEVPLLPLVPELPEVPPDVPLELLGALGVTVPPLLLELELLELEEPDVELEALISEPQSLNP
jgi:hypothetical protein